MMKWNLPADVTSPLRKMKKQKWFTTPEAGKFAINHLGENENQSVSQSVTQRPFELNNLVREYLISPIGIGGN